MGYSDFLFLGSTIVFAPQANFHKFYLFHCDLSWLFLLYYGILYSFIRLEVA